MGYFKESAKGVSWVGAFRVGTRGIAFVRTIILARILAPAQFGVFGIATLVISLLEILTETGINIFLIQRKSDISRFVSTAWIISIVRGLLIAAVLVALAPFISTFFNSPESLQAVYLISLVALIRGFINPAIVRFQKELRFAAEFRFRFSIFAFDSAVAIAMSLATGSATGLLLGLIAGALLEVVMSFVFVSPRPTLGFSLKQAREILSKGKWITGAGIFQFLFKQGDDAVVGRVLGEGALGYYQVAYKISTLPISEVTDVVNRVVFPVYVKIASDRARLKWAFLRTTGVVSLVATLLGIVLFIFGENVVIFFLGEQWLEIIPLLKILIVFGVVQAVSNSMNSLLLALEKQKSVTVATFISVVALALSIIPLVGTFGLWGAAAAPLIGSICALPFMVWFVYKSINEKHA